VVNGQINSCIAIPFTNLEPAFMCKRMAKKENKRLDSRYDLHVHSIRKRLADVDGISAKAAIDGLVKAGLLEDDSTEFIREIRFSQEKGTPEVTKMIFRKVKD